MLQRVRLLVANSDHLLHGTVVYSGHAELFSSRRLLWQENETDHWWDDLWRVSALYSSCGGRMGGVKGWHWGVSGFAPRMGSCHFLFICPTGISCRPARSLNCWLEGEGGQVYIYIYIYISTERGSERGRMNSWGLQWHLARARDGHKQIHREKQCTLSHTSSQW